MPIASVELEISDEAYAFGNLEVFDTYENTISLMKQIGIYSDSVINRDDISEVVVTNYYPGYDLEVTDSEDILEETQSVSHTYTDRKDIDAILEAAIPTDFYNPWYNYNNNNSQYSIEVSKNGEQYTSAYYTFLRGKVPSVVAEDTEK